MHFASSTIINWFFWAIDCTSSDSFCWIFIKKMSLTAKTQFSCWSSLNSGVVYGVGTSSFSFKQTSRNILSEVYQTSSWMNFSYRGSKNSECRCQFSKKKNSHHHFFAWMQIWCFLSFCSCQSVPPLYLLYFSTA